MDFDFSKEQEKRIIKTQLSLCDQKLSRVNEEIRMNWQNSFSTPSSKENTDYLPLNKKSDFQLQQEKRNLESSCFKLGRSLDNLEKNKLF